MSIEGLKELVVYINNESRADYGNVSVIPNKLNYAFRHVPLFVAMANVWKFQYKTCQFSVMVTM